jgi:hypothetical protein
MTIFFRKDGIIMEVLFTRGRIMFSKIYVTILISSKFHFYGELFRKKDKFRMCRF